MSGTNSLRRPGTRPSFGPSYSAEAQQFFDRVSDPGATRKALYATLIDALVAAGVWAKLDALYILAAADAATALTNLKSTDFEATAVNSPTFTTDRGYAGNGSSSYVDTNFNPSSGTPNFTLNSAHISAWNRTARSGNGSVLMGNTGTTNRINMYPRYTDNNAYVRVNDAFGGLAVAGSDGFLLGNRSGANARQVYKNGVSIGSGAVETTALVNANIDLGRGDTGTHTTDQFAAASIGASLTSDEQLELYTALNTYLVAVGAA